MTDPTVSLVRGDCREVVRGIPDCSFDSVVTDPPYALVSIANRFGKASEDDGTQTGDRVKRRADPYARAARGFMGKEWDTGDVAFDLDFWRGILRVLKPGAHLVAFGGTRTYHRLACAIEDAGFEIRDQIGWCYATGFPKSHDVSKGIDKAAGMERTVRTVRTDDGTIYGLGHSGNVVDNLPITELARDWDGWGTALKPAWEPIVLARKPLGEKTVAANVLKWGTGALNIDGCRVTTVGESFRTPYGNPANRKGVVGSVFFTGSASIDNFQAAQRASIERLTISGRWPANLCHDGSDEVLACFPEVEDDPEPTRPERGRLFSLDEVEATPASAVESNDLSAARFFFCPKADEGDRAGSGHPTVKPVMLMRWLLRMVTPPGGLSLDPFAGSGTTLQAAFDEGFRAVGIEREPSYVVDIRRRLKRAGIRHTVRSVGESA